MSTQTSHARVMPVLVTFVGRARSASRDAAPIARRIHGSSGRHQGRIDELQTHSEGAVAHSCDSPPRRSGRVVTMPSCCWILWVCFCCFGGDCSLLLWLCDADSSYLMLTMPSWCHSSRIADSTRLHSFFDPPLGERIPHVPARSHTFPRSHRPTEKLTRRPFTVKNSPARTGRSRVFSRPFARTAVGPRGALPRAEGRLRRRTMGH